jgi:Flp pilus assembly protein TadG
MIPDPKAARWISAHRARRASETGTALVEMAVALPFLVLVLVGTIDFARVFYTAMELTNAARAGAQYGAADTARAFEAPPMADVVAAAQAAAPNIAPVTAVASRSCQCATDDTGATFAPAASCTSACPAGQHMVINIAVTATKTFTTISPFPGVPQSINLSRSATMRLAN